MSSSSTTRSPAAPPGPLSLLPTSFDLSPSSATSILSHLSTLDARGKVRFVKTLLPRLYFRSIASPPSSVDECIDLIHNLDASLAEKGETLPVFSTFKCGFVETLKSECTSLWQPSHTPDFERENALPKVYYRSALVTGLLIGRLFAATPAPHDDAETTQLIWTQLVEAVIQRSVFVDFEAASAAPANIVLLPALLYAAAGSVGQFLALRQKGKGRDYVWYDDACKLPEEEWGWEDITASLRQGFNERYRDKHTYPPSTTAFWRSVSDTLSSSSNIDDLKDATTSQTMDLYTHSLTENENEEEEKQTYTATLRVNDEVQSLVSALRHLLSRVEERYATAPSHSLAERIESLSAIAERRKEGGAEGEGEEEKIKDAKEMVERIGKELGL